VVDARPSDRCPDLLESEVSGLPARGAEVREVARQRDQISDDELERSLSRRRALVLFIIVVAAGR
jgi:hypothetical protein